MSTVSVCDGMGLGLAAEFWRSLEKGGFTVTDAKLVINSPDNAAARAMFAALQELGAGFEKDQLFGSSIYSVKVPVVKPEIDLRTRLKSPQQYQYKSHLHHPHTRRYESLTILPQPPRLL